VRYVGDGDPRRVGAVWLAPRPDGVVVVARVLRVDRRQGQGREILPAKKGVGGDLSAETLRFRHGGLRVRLLDALANQDLGNLDLRIAGRSEHRLERALCHFARRLRVARDANDGGRAILRRCPGVRCERDGPANPIVVRLEDERLATTPQRPSHALGPAAQDAQHGSLRSARGLRDELGRDQVAVHCTPHRVFGHVEVVAIADRGDESEASRMHAEDPLALLLRRAGFFLRAEALPGQRADRARAGHVVEQVEQGRIARLLDVQPGRYFAGVHGPRLGSQEVEDGPASGRRVGHESRIPE
jgi:hypothetical protein